MNLISPDRSTPPHVSGEQVLAGIIGLHSALTFGFMVTSFLLSDVDLAGG
jgi:hypothetical protein